MRLSDHSCAIVINTLEGVYIMDAREELKRWIAMVVQMSAEEESKVIKQDIDVFLSAAGTLSGTLASRNTALARQIRPRSSASPADPSPHAGPQQQDDADSSDDTPASPNDAEDRSQERSGQSQQSDAEANDTDRSDQEIMRQQTYGQQDDETRLRQAAKRIAR